MFNVSWTADSCAALALFYVGGDVCIAHVVALARLKADSADSTEASTNYLASTTPGRWLARAGVTNMV